MIKKRVVEGKTQELCWMMNDTKNWFFRLFWGWQGTKANGISEFIFSKKDWKSIKECAERLEKWR